MAKTSPRFFRAAYITFRELKHLRIGFINTENWKQRFIRKDKVSAGEELTIAQRFTVPKAMTNGKKSRDVRKNGKK